MKQHIARQFVGVNFGSSGSGNVAAFILKAGLKRRKRRATLPLAVPRSITQTPISHGIGGVDGDSLKLPRKGYVEIINSLTLH